MFLENKNIIFKIRRSKVTDYAALMPPDKWAYLNISFLISQPKHVMGTLKNHLNETVLLNTQNIC